MKPFSFFRKNNHKVLHNNRNIRDFSMELTTNEKIIIEFLNDINKKFIDKNSKNDFLAQGNYFETFLLSLFQSAGYETKITEKKIVRNHVEYFGDKNVDLIAIKGTERIAIQAKNKRLNVKEPALINKDFINNYAGISDNGWTRKLFITTTFLNPYAFIELKENEKTKNIEWIDRIGLFSLINELNPTIFIKQNFQKSLPENIQKCPECETGYLITKYAYGKHFLGCHNFPECKHKEGI